MVGKVIWIIIAVTYLAVLLLMSFNKIVKEEILIRVSGSSQEINVTTLRLASFLIAPITIWIFIKWIISQKIVEAKNRKIEKNYQEMLSRRRAEAASTVLFLGDGVND